jgi:hypothetical protein
MLAVETDPDDQNLWSPLEPWISQQFLKNHDAMPADSWFIDNLEGVQVARSPMSDKSFGEFYGYRDYFHGQGENLDPAEARGVAPIHDINLSAVYKSDTSHALKVAFSVPIWSSAEPSERRVLGVLAMSVNVADFQVLEEDMSAGKEIVLIDTRPAEIDGQEIRGLILFHPEQRKGQQVRASDAVLAAIESDEQFISDYNDPLAKDSKQVYWGALQPVVYAFRETGEGEPREYRPGWVVLVQTPALD